MVAFSGIIVASNSTAAPPSKPQLHDKHLFAKLQQTCESPVHHAKRRTQQHIRKDRVTYHLSTTPRP